MLAGMDLPDGRPNGDSVSPLSALGLAQHQSSRWQRIAAIPEDAFDKHLGQRAFLAYDLTPLYEAEAKERQGTRTDLADDFVADLPQSPPEPKSRDKAAKALSSSGQGSTGSEPHRCTVGNVPDPATAVLSWLMTPGIGEQLPTLEDLCRRPPWQRRAACRGESIETFIPRPGGNFTRARELCARCPVRQECFVIALADPELVGMWAGSTERERRKLRRVA